MRILQSIKQRFSGKNARIKQNVTRSAAATVVPKEPYQGSLNTLKRLIPIGSLDQQQLAELNVLIITYQPGAIIFNRGEAAESLIYLLSGDVFLETTGMQGISVQADTFEALHPLSSGDYRNATAICKKKSEVIWVPMVAMDLYKRQNYIKTPNSLELPKHYQNNTLLTRFISAGHTTMPMLPDVALKLRDVMRKDPAIADVVKIITLDPTLSAKLVQVANSPIYRTMQSITTCRAAVTRIGLHNTKNLITSISLRSLFEYRHKALNALAQKFWKKSIRISALSYTLAKLTGACDPEEALLAGLITHIGIVPFLKFADKRSDDLYRFEDIDEALPFVTGPLSTMILEKWDFPDNLKNIPMATQDWFLTGGDKTTADLNDVVVLAKYHSLLGSGKPKLPPITSLPSYAYLKHAELTPNKSLKILQDAKLQVDEAMRFFTH